MAADLQLQRNSLLFRFIKFEFRQNFDLYVTACLRHRDAFFFVTECFVYQLDPAILISVYLAQKALDRQKSKLVTLFSVVVICYSEQ